MSTIRTFVAVEIPDEVRHRAAALVERLRAAQAKVRWTDLTTMHWTMNFLGDVPDREIAAVCARLPRRPSRSRRSIWKWRGSARFPNGARPRTIWLGAGVGKEPLADLQAALERHLATLGFRPEARRFQPHLTLGRVRDGSTGLTELADRIHDLAEFDAGTMFVNKVVVFSSRLERAGAVHERLGGGPLQGPPAAVPDE